MRLKTECRARGIHGSLQQKGVTLADVKTIIAHSSLNRQERDAEEDEGMGEMRGKADVYYRSMLYKEPPNKHTHNRNQQGLSNLQQRPRYNPSSHSEVQRFMLIIITLPWLFNLLF